MPVPLLDLRRQNLALKAELMEAFERVLDSGHFILGKEVEEFERQAAEVAGARYAIGVSSGTDALSAALMALDIGPGDEVICPSFTFFATAGCVDRLGATPVFADCHADSFNLNLEDAQSRITPATRAIIPVHLFGQAVDMHPLLDLAQRHGIAVIEDAAQAFGAEYHGRPVGALGELGTISFFPSKNLGALGDAGLVVTNHVALAEKVKLLRNHGMHPKYFHAMVGGNFRLDALQAALLAVKLPHLARYTELRQQHARRYDEAFARLHGGEAVSVITPAKLEGRTHIVNQYTIRVCRGAGWRGSQPPRDTLRSRLQEQGIASEIYYPVPLHRQECFTARRKQPALPVSERLAEEVLSLPVFPELCPEEQAAVIEAVCEFASTTTD